MPELPEVETIVRDLNKSLPRRIFADVIVHDAFVLRGAKSEFVRRLVGQTIRKILRRGKAVVMHMKDENNIWLEGELQADNFSTRLNDKNFNSRHIPLPGKKKTRRPRYRRGRRVAKLVLDLMLFI